MSKRSRELVSAYLSGKSKEELFEYDLISPPRLAQDIYQALKSRGVSSRVSASKNESDVIDIVLESRSYLADGIIELFEQTYPEYHILVHSKGA